MHLIVVSAAIFFTRSMCCRISKSKVLMLFGSWLQWLRFLELQFCSITESPNLCNITSVSYFDIWWRTLRCLYNLRHINVCRRKHHFIFAFHPRSLRHHKNSSPIQPWHSCLLNIKSCFWRTLKIFSTTRTSLKVVQHNVLNVNAKAQYYTLHCGTVLVWTTNVYTEMYVQLDTEMNNWQLVTQGKHKASAKHRLWQCCFHSCEQTAFAD